ncbi:hypothetical protein HDV05_001153 [Chytridiales sp. JEL 0842]|nr:hypothetical protein HDV05_001153 [Chytridiales sp. JEL 0842]
MAATLEAIKYKRGYGHGQRNDRSLQILDQLLLPFESVYEDVKGVQDGFDVIKSMKVRGAPAIAIVAALSLAVEIHKKQTSSASTLTTAAGVKDFIQAQLEHLKESRPTAVNLFEAAGRLLKLTVNASEKKDASAESVMKVYLDAAEAMLERDIQDNKNIGKFGAEFILKNKKAGEEVGVNVVTHCNTGSLATAGWGTALGIIRDLYKSGSLNHVYCTETRPYNQGGRLTAYELVYEKIPSTLITDSMASALLKEKKISAIVVGADRVAANGDTANKIGTYQLAITAKYHGVHFIVAAPSTSIDLSLSSGTQIPIEFRSGNEVVQIRGEVLGGEKANTATVHIAAKGINVWNPSFDVTPASLISAIVTEKGVITKLPGSITGQDGSYLTEFLLGKGYVVHGIIRRSSSFNTGRIEHLYKDQHERPKMILHYGDLTDTTCLVHIISQVQPTEIYNLGAQSHVKVSFDMAQYTADVDGVGTLRLLDAIRTCGLTNHVKFYQASTSELYGKVVEIPQSETTPFYPRSPYGVAKQYAYWIVVNYREAYNMFACNGILFNHESPRRGQTFVTRKITRAVASIHLNLQPCVYLGNIDARRDWGHARDYVEGMWLMLQHDKPEDFVLATGETHTVREFVEKAFGYVGITIEWRGKAEEEVGVDSKTGKVVVRIDPKYYRPTEVDILLGDPSKAKKELGWERRTSFDELIKEMVEADVKLLQANANDRN